MKMIEILLIDDDLSIGQRVKEALNGSNMSIRCSCATSCEQGLEMLKLRQFDLVLADMRFPNHMDGLTLIKTLRNSKMNTPIIVISGTAEVQEKIRALDLGADDYILKPFDKQELIARIKRHIFRNNNHLNSKCVVGSLTLDMETKVVIVKGRDDKKHVIKLTNKEYQLLEILVLKKGVTMSKFLLLQQLYSGHSSNPDVKIIDVVMCKIRGKIAKYSDEKLIVTSWGRGYSVEEQVTSVDGEGEGSENTTNTSMENYSMDKENNKPANSTNNNTRNKKTMAAGLKYML
jgi:two-component system cell cycle response regulator CtrA